MVRALRQLMANLALTLATVVVACGSAELVTRLLWDHVPEGAYVGISLRGPNRRVVHKGIEYRTNSLGLRDRELTTSKRPGSLRVLGLGDSFLFGDGLPDTATVTAQLERRLKRRYPDVEVINAGVTGYNTRDELDQLKRLAPELAPDAIILFFYTNDLEPSDARQRARVGPQAPGPSRPSWQVRLKHVLWLNSRFFAFLHYLYKDRLAGVVGVPRAVLGAEYVDLTDANPGWVDFKQALREIGVYCDQRSMPLLVVLIPTLTVLNSNYPYADLRTSVTRVVAEQRIPVVDLFDTFAPYRPSDLWASIENGHWNAHATGLAAERIADFIAQERLLDHVRARSGAAGSSAARRGEMGENAAGQH